MRAPEYLGPCRSKDCAREADVTLDGRPLCRDHFIEVVGILQWLAQPMSLRARRLTWLALATIVVILLVSVVAAWATPFDRTATYALIGGCLNTTAACTDDGPVTAISALHPLWIIGASLVSVPAGPGAMRLGIEVGLPPIPDDCHGCLLTVSGIGSIIGLVPSFSSPFSAPTLHIRLREVDGQWALDQPDLGLLESTPEPLTLFLFGTGLAVVGWRVRRMKG